MKKLFYLFFIVSGRISFVQEIFSSKYYISDELGEKTVMETVVSVMIKDY